MIKKVNMVNEKYNVADLRLLTFRGGVMPLLEALGPMSRSLDHTKEPTK